MQHTMINFGNKSNTKIQTEKPTKKDQSQISSQIVMKTYFIFPNMINQKEYNVIFMKNPSTSNSIWNQEI